MPISPQPEPHAHTHTYIVLAKSVGGQLASHGVSIASPKEVESDFWYEPYIGLHDMHRERAMPAWGHECFRTKVAFVFV